MIYFFKYLIGIFLISISNLGFALTSPQLIIKVNPQDGSYDIYNKDKSILHAQVATKIDCKWIHASDYPKHFLKKSTVKDELGLTQQTIITHTGLANQPDLTCILRALPQQNAGEVIVEVTNHLKKSVKVQAIRLLESNNFNFGNNLRVLSDTYSEDRPTLKIYDFQNAPNNMHLAVGSQLIYNLDTQQSLLFATMTSKRFLTILRLHVPNNKFQIDSTGTTEINKDYCLKNAPNNDLIELSLPVDPGTSLISERLLFNISSDYHTQLESYGKLIGSMYNARISAPTPMGWWSWTAYYKELYQDQAENDATWLAQNLKPLGYNFFHLDEGYQSARGDYTTSHPSHFPDGLHKFGNKIHDLSLTLGIWTAPFEVSNHSGLFKNHKDWLVHNASGHPIELGREDGKKSEKLFALDTTHPEVQKYLRDTYSTIAKKWGAKYFKLDFMEDSAIEGHHFEPNITALEAQRIGLNIIRQAVGDDVLLDKDGSPMLNLVGIVDTGRISVDTGHEFSKTKAAAVGIAARYYMHRNFFVSDPDAFCISRYRYGSAEPLTLDEAKTSIALAAVSGGMFEIGDNLQLLKSQPERLELLKNPELLKIVRDGRVSIPLDLMNYLAEEEQPSIFFLSQNVHQAILTVFNWTDQLRTHNIDLKTLGFSTRVKLYDILENQQISADDNNNRIWLTQAPHSVHMIKITS